MNKNLYRIICLLLAVLLPIAALAQQEEPQVLEGLVIEVLEDGFLLDDIQRGTVMLNTDETTVWDGILAETGAPEKGQYVLVWYDGRLTRSIPPQAHADKVGCYTLNGSAAEFYENGVLLTGDPLFGDVLVHMDGVETHVYQGMPITVYYDGIMALSLPGQVNARYIVVPELRGAVSGVTEEGFTLTDGEGHEYTVLVNDETFRTEKQLVVEEGIEIEPSDVIQWQEGDVVQVLYNGMMTRSIPAQITALEVCVLR